jgi:hypothetical protein
MPRSAVTESYEAMPATTAHRGSWLGTGRTPRAREPPGRTSVFALLRIPDLSMLLRETVQRPAADIRARDGEEDGYAALEALPVPRARLRSRVATEWSRAASHASISS